MERLTLGGEVGELYNITGIRTAVCCLEEAKALLLKHHSGGLPGMVDERMARSIAQAHQDIYVACLQLESALEYVRTTRTNLSRWLEEWDRQEKEKARG